jgi:DNA primase
LNVARDAVARLREIVVVEGYTDTIMAHQAGVDHVVAVCGTALGPKHLRLLRRFADRVILVLDGDEAGQRRTNELLGLFVGEQVDLRILTLPEKLDPCDFLLTQGGDAFREMLAGAIDALEHKVRSCTRGIDLVTETHRAHQALEEILDTMARAPHGPAEAGGEARLREHQMLARLARRFGIADSQLRVRLGELRRKSAMRSPPAAERSPQAKPAPHLREMHPRDIELLEILVMHPEYVAQAVAEIELGHLHSQPTREIFHTLHRLYEEGRTPDFGNVLTGMDDPAWKNIWVEIDERARAKAEEAQEDGRQRLQGLIADYRYALEKKNRPYTEAALQEKRLDEQEELYVLQMLIAQERNRHGISGPMEG